MQHQIGSTEATLRQLTASQKETNVWLQKIWADQSKNQQEQRQHHFDQQTREMQLLAKIDQMLEAQNLANARQLEFQVKVLENQTHQTRLHEQKLEVLHQVAKSSHKTADKVDNMEFRQSFSCQIPQDQGSFQIDSIDFDRFDRLDRFDSFDLIRSIRSIGSIRFIRFDSIDSIDSIESIRFIRFDLFDSIYSIQSIRFDLFDSFDSIDVRYYCVSGGLQDSLRHCDGLATGHNWSISPETAQGIANCIRTGIDYYGKA